MLVQGERGQVWWPTRYVLPVGLPALVLAAAALAISPAAADTWWWTVLVVAAAALPVGLLGTLGLWLGPGRHRTVDTGDGLRLHRWWGTREVAWADVERVVVAADGSAEGTFFTSTTELLPRVVVLTRSGRRHRMTFVALDDLVTPYERVAAACAAHGVEVSGTDVGWWTHRWQRWRAHRASRG